MRTAYKLLASLLLVAIFTAPVFAQDTGIPDTCRYDPSVTTWTVNSLDDAEFSVELWAFTDVKLKGMSLGFSVLTSSGGGTGHDDSLLIVSDFTANYNNDTGIHTSAAYTSVISYSYLDTDTYGGLDWGYNGYTFAPLIVFGPDSLIHTMTPVKIGDVTLQLTDPENMSSEFDIVIDSAFFPPGGTFKFSPGVGYAPQFVSSTISVVNNLGQAVEEPEIGLDATSFTFDAVEGEGNPDDQILNISNIGSGDLNWTVEDDAEWLTLSPESGTNDGAVTLSVDVTGLSPNQYTASITVSDPNATNDPQTVNVTLDYAAGPPTIAVDLDSLGFAAVEGEENPAAQVITITNVGGSQALAWTASESADWLSVSPASGVDGDVCSLFVDIGELMAGTYMTAVNIVDDDATNSPYSVKVMLFLDEPAPVITLDPEEFNFEATVDGANPDMQYLTINNAGGGSLSWTATESADWLYLISAAGSDGDSCSLAVDISGLPVGLYSTDVTVTDAAADNSPQTATVNLTINDLDPVIEVDYTEYMFSATKDGVNPDNQTLTITNAGGGTLNWEVADDAAWLTLTPSSGAAGESTALSVDITGLDFGTYYATVTVSDPGGVAADVEVEVALTVGVDFTITPGEDPDPISIPVDVYTGLAWIVLDQGSIPGWLTLDPLEGIQGTDQLSVTVDISGLDPDDYSYTIRVDVNPAKDISVIDIPITFTVPPAPKAEVRVIHTSYDAPAVDVSLDGSLAISNLSYGLSSGYAEVDAGTRNVTVTPTGEVTPVVIDVDLTLEEDKDYTVFATNELSMINAIFDEDLRTPDPSQAKLRFVHASPDAPAVDIKLNDGNGALVFGNAAFEDITAYTSVAAGSYTFAVTATGSTDEVVIFEPVAVTAGTVYTVVAHGTLDPSDAYPFSVRVFIDNDPGDAYVDLVPQVPEIGVLPPSVAFEMDEGINPAEKTIDIMNDGTGTLEFTLQNNESWLLLSYPSGTATPGSPFTLTLSIDGDELDPDLSPYTDTIWVTDENASNSPVWVPVTLTIIPEPVEVLDSVFVGTAAGVPGEQVVVPVDFKNTVDISGVDLPISFVGEVNLDSVSFVGSRVDGMDITTPININNTTKTAIIGVIAASEDLIPAGNGLLCNLFFTIDAGAATGDVPIETIVILGPPDHELMFTLDEDPYAIYPGYEQGSISIIAPCLEDITTVLEFEAYEGGDNPTDQTFDIVNCGDGALLWTAYNEEDWLSIDPTEGNDGATVTASVDITGLAADATPYSDTIFVEAIGVDNSPQKVVVLLTILPPPAEDIAGVVVESGTSDAIEGATVQLWTGGMVVDETTSAGDGSFLFAEYSGDYTLRVYMDGYYPTILDIAAPDEEIEVGLDPTQNITPTPDYMFIYCDGYAMLDDVPVQPGDVIEAWDPRGFLCGQFFVTTEGTYGAMAVYGDDPETAEADGFEDGEAVTLTLNLYDVTPFLADPLHFNSIYNLPENMIEACFDARTEETFCTWLFNGWNLISWNVDTESDEVLDVISSIVDEVQMIISFEQGGLVWDPELLDFSNLNSLDHYHGYWFRILTDADSLEFCVTGLPVNSATPIALEQGWNLVSYLPDMEYATEDALANLISGDNLLYALGWDQGEGGTTWDPDDPISSNLDYLKPGKGYWYKVNTTMDLVYSSPVPLATYAIEPDNTSQKFSGYTKVVPTNSWVNVYGSSVTVDGSPIPVGAIVDAVTEDGTICGTFVVHTSGQLGFMPVYGDDATTSATDGLDAGESFQIVVNGVETEETFTWTGHADNVEIGTLNSVAGSEPIMPMAFELQQNYPNPFNPSTTIGYELGKGGHVTLTVYNILGAVVTTLVDEYQGAGSHRVEWNGNDANGRTVSSGVYFYKISAGEFSETKKMMLMK